MATLLRLTMGTLTCIAASLTVHAESLMFRPPTLWVRRSWPAHSHQPQHPDRSAIQPVPRLVRLAGAESERCITAAHIDLHPAYSLGASGTSPEYGELRAMTANTTTLWARVQVPANVFEEVRVPVRLNAPDVTALNKARGKSLGTGIANVTPNLSDGTYVMMSRGLDPARQHLVIEYAP